MTRIVVDDLQNDEVTSLVEYMTAMSAGQIAQHKKVIEVNGLTNKKIGTNMGLSESSVKNIVQRLFGKAGVKTRSQLVRVALEGSLGTTRQLISRQLKKTLLADQPKSNQTRQPIATNLSPARQSHG